MSLELKSVNALLRDETGMRARYFIPAYQRGYRWDRRQVTQLLEDIWEFVQANDEQSKEAFYCLQPLVVRKRDDRNWEVVDGQQRLTTIYILLAHSRISKIVDIFEIEPFSIEYETRDPTYLTNIDETRASENIDFYHIYEAWRTIEDWLNERDRTSVIKLIQHLLNDDEVGPNVRFIWYELASGDDPIAAFTRLNVGKIPLTETELIRALILQHAIASDPTHRLYLRIAYEWDEFEKYLQDDAIWYFLQDQYPVESTRIGLLFRLLARMNEGITHEADYAVFSYYSELMREGEGVENVWQNVKDVFKSLEEWYEDRYLFHVLGFVFHQSRGNLETITTLLSSSRELGKKAFVDTLRSRIWQLFCDEELETFTHENLSEEIRDICEATDYQRPAIVQKLLLLFNLATLLNDERSNIRFQFDSFKKERWDIEHIRPSSDRPSRESAQRLWLEQCLRFLHTVKGFDDLLKKIESFITNTGEQELEQSFEDIDGEILSQFNCGEYEQDDLSNLTLLDSQTNRGYQNAVFAVKRHILLERDRSGIYVPLCTRNIFLKAYSDDVGNLMFWDDNDAKSYVEEIVRTLASFFGSTMGIEQ